nr:MAG TPA: hypothetical protein [Caudoviricetes sp.]DAP01505.1 MAG TPA: hypothetical protein [Caudoviricetes sp.]
MDGLTYPPIRTLNNSAWFCIRQCSNHIAWA